MRPIVVKVGGSLYDVADLVPRLNAFLVGLAAPVFIVPGGGPTAEAIREFDRMHHLGDEAAHWLALRACSINGHVLSRLLGEFPVVADCAARSGVAIVDLFAFAVDDERRPDRWPHRWVVTSDSMAVRVANVAGASELILLKSIDIPSDFSWRRAAADGWVDPYFPDAVARTPGLVVRALNFRTRREGEI